jgi:hypothetical protein
MTRTSECELGREAFRKFIAGLLAMPFENIPLHESHRPIPPFRTVTRRAMLERFLDMRPNLTPFSAQFGDVYCRCPQFVVNSVVWNELPPARRERTRGI